MPDRNMTIVNVYSSSRYTQKEIAQTFNIYYATVNRIVKTKTDF